MPEVFTLENKEHYSTGVGCISNRQYSDKEIMAFRQEYVTKSAKEIYNSLSNPLITYQSFQKLLSGDSFKYLPYYSKKRGRWIKPGENVEKLSPNRGKHKVVDRIFSDEEVMQYRKEYVTQTAEAIYKKYELKSIISLDSFSKMLRGVNYSHLPYYSKITK